MDKKVDFLKDTDTETDFFYDCIEDKETYKIAQDLMINCFKKIKPVFCSIDFAVDKNGKVFLIEMNLSSGMGPNKVALFYESVYNDFYHREVTSYTKERLDYWKEVWKKSQNKLEKQIK